jgi:hypothetical protein
VSVRVSPILVSKGLTKIPLPLLGNGSVKRYRGNEYIRNNIRIFGRAALYTVRVVNNKFFLDFLLPLSYAGPTVFRSNGTPGRNESRAPTGGDRHRKAPENTDPLLSGKSNTGLATRFVTFQSPVILYVPPALIH